MALIGEPPADVFDKIHYINHCKQGQSHLLTMEIKIIVEVKDDGTIGFGAG